MPVLDPSIDPTSGFTPAEIRALECRTGQRYGWPCRLCDGCVHTFGRITWGFEADPMACTHYLDRRCADPARFRRPWDGGAAAFVHAAEQGYALNHVAANVHVLDPLGLLEEAVVLAASRAEGWSDLAHKMPIPDRLRLLKLLSAHRLRLLRPTPAGVEWPLRLYRGVTGARRRHRAGGGLFWTTRREVAAWFASIGFHGPRRDPAVLVADVTPGQVRWWPGGAHHEVIARVDWPEPLPLGTDEILTLAREHSAVLEAAGWCREMSRREAERNGP